jgi:hypothetical protein
MLKGNTCSSILDVIFKGLDERLTHPYAYEGSFKLRVLEPLTPAPQACGDF